MPLYEHVMIARQDLSNTQAEGLIEHFGTVLADNGGNSLKASTGASKRWPTKSTRTARATMPFCATDAPAPAVQEMERLMRCMMT